MARPSDYSEETANKIINGIAGGLALASICAEEGMPDRVTVYRWLAKHEEFRNNYARAKEEQADTLADEIVAIADEECTTVKGGEGGEIEVVFDSTAVARNRLRVDARKWVASKLKPKKYGERTSLEHSGPDGGAIPIEKIERVIVRPPNSDG